MPKYYCDYCDTYLTHDSPSVRKTHCQGRKHKENVRDYYQKWMEEQAQKLVCLIFFKFNLIFFI
jgi:U1 small nuclear ribonucleoprotein C